MLFARLLTIYSVASSFSAVGRFLPTVASICWISHAVPSPTKNATKSGYQEVVGVHPRSDEDEGKKDNYDESDGRKVLGSLCCEVGGEVASAGPAATLN